MSETSPTSSFIDCVVRVLDEWDASAYVVGGAVRDRLAGEHSLDLDVALSGDAAAASEVLAARCGGKPVALDAERGYARVVSGGGEQRGWVDLSSYDSDLEADLRRRDFTINAMAVPLSRWLESDIREYLVDPFGGHRDLDRGVIRQTSPKAISSDAVRAVRAARFAAQFGFELSADTVDSARKCGRALRLVSAERVRDELFAIFRLRRAFPGIDWLDRLGLIDVIFPELCEGRGVVQPKEHYWDVFTHNLRTVEMADRVLDADARNRDALLRFVPWRPELDEYFAEVVADHATRSALLRLTALLHDVSKPEKKTTEPSGRIRFLGHDDRGAEVVTAILRRLRCSRRVIAHVSLMVREHLRPSQLSHGRATPSKRALFRYYRDLNGVALDTLYLNLSDYLAARGPRLEAPDWRSYCEMIGDILSQGFEQQRDSKPSLLFDGYEIQQLFALSPGPEIGRLLGILRDAEAAGQVQTRAQALQLLKGSLNSRANDRRSGQ